ncbi:hypothetical protein DL96DRAFT_1709923 [Flagelloscypha sp. PMI_526]|nr:hypothetical protein DL96DRAFT_1709923 [Flagelloscypha sp. PMI_526]
MSSRTPGNGLRVLTLDGSTSCTSGLSGLFSVQHIGHRWAFDNDPDEREAGDIQVSELFDVVGGTGIGGFDAILFAVLSMTIGQVITSHNILYDQVFSSESWIREDHVACSLALDSALDLILEQCGIHIDLDSPFGSKGEPIKCFVCLQNKNTTRMRALRNYRIRTSPPSPCTIRQALRATLADGNHLPPVVFQYEQLVNGMIGYANPSRELMMELPVVLPKGSHLACFVNIGSGHPSAEGVARDLLLQYHDLGPCYFRLSVQDEMDAADEVYSQTIEYLDADEVSEQINDIVDILVNPHGVVSIERFRSLAGEDGKAKLNAQVEAVHEDVGYIRANVDQDIFRRMKEWLQPVDQTAKLDENIQARGVATCEWFLEHPGVVKWKLEPGRSSWFHGAMGTGKTVIISYLVHSLIQARYTVAYYYFDFTNLKTLSEEALFRSLVAQLSHVNETLARAVYEKHRHGADQPQLVTLQATFFELASTSIEPVFVIMDALDELPPQQRACFLEMLEKTGFLHHDHLHLMVTSRDEIDISKRLEGKVPIEIVVEDVMIRRDIAVVVEKELSSEKWKFWPNEERTMLIEKLNQRADGQFRMLACQIEVLRHVETSGDLRRVLKLLPRKLGETYSYILESIPEDLRARARTLLSILSFALEPIPLGELSALLAVEFESPLDEANLPRYCKESRYHQPQNIIGLGSALVRTERSWGPNHPPFLRLAHASVKEYLLQNDFHWSHINEKLANEIISSTCLALLLHNLAVQVDHRLAIDTYVRPWWYRHVSPSCSEQLLAQQIALFQSFPWSRLRSFEIPLDAIGHVKQNEILENQLGAAAAAGLVDILGIMLDMVQDMNVLNHALVVATAAGASLTVITLLVTQGADVNTLNESIGTPLQSAASEGDLEVVEFLTKQGAKVNLEGGYYYSPLIAAASEGKLGVIKFLLRDGADVNLAGREHGTALQAAALLSRLDIVEFLVANGASMNIVAGDYGTALQAAAYIGSLQIVEFLVGNGADTNIVGGMYGSALLAAASEGEREIVEFLVRNGADINLVTGEYGSALHTAARMGRLDITEFLIANGADMNIVGGKYGTPILAAASEGEMDIVEFLLKNGADVNAVGRAPVNIGSGH